MAGWGETKAMGYTSGPRLSEQMEFVDFPENKWVTVRFFGPITSSCQGFINIKKKDGTVSKGFPKICLDYDPAKQEFVKDICPYRKAGIKMGQRFYSNVIVRSLEKKRPSKVTRTESEKTRKPMLGEKLYIKDMDADSWTPCRVLGFPASILREIQDISQLNTVKGKVKEVNDPEYGFDVMIKHNPSAKAPGDKWKVQKGERTPLTDKEKKFLVYNLAVSALKPEKLETAKTELAGMIDRIVVRGDDNKWHPLKAKSKKGADNFEDDDDEEDNDRRRLSLEEDDDEDERPKKPKSKSKKRRESLEDEDEEDEKPSKKKASAKSSKTKKTGASAKAKASGNKKKKARLNLDEDEDRPSKRNKKKKRSSAIDDDDVPF